MDYMKGLDSCERCGDMVAYKDKEDHTIEKGETVILVETNPKNNSNCIKKTELYHPDCYQEKIKEELEEEV